MNKDKTVRILEFLITFFSKPDRLLFEMIYNGKTPLGEIETTDSFEEFYQETTEEITDLFVNSPNQRPLYPMASEYLKDHDAKDSLIYTLNELYIASGKTVKSYPADHLIVLYEFILDDLYHGNDSKASDFYLKQIKDWTKQFAKAILNRKPNKCICQIVSLIDRLESQFEQESITDGK